MKSIIITALAIIPSSILGAGAVYLALHGISGWWWFLAAAVLLGNVQISAGGA